MFPEHGDGQPGHGAISGWGGLFALLEVDLDPGTKALRVFGCSWLVVLGVLGVWVRFQQSLLFFVVSAQWADQVSWVLWGLALVGGLLALAAPRALRPFYVGLTLATYPFGLVLSHGVVSLLFFGVVLPVGLVRRCLGYDSLTRRFDPATKSYWHQKKAVDNVARYYRQY